MKYCLSLVLSLLGPHCIENGQEYLPVVATTFAADTIMNGLAILLNVGSFKNVRGRSMHGQGGGRGETEDTSITYPMTSFRMY